MALGTQIIILVVLIVFSALFSGIETALMSVSQIKVDSLVRQKRRGSQALSRIKANPSKLIITILIGNNLVNIGAASLATVAFTNLFGSAGVGIATGVMTFLILVFGEITPKTFASQNAVRVSLLVARPVEILSYILSPLVKFFGLITKITSKLLGSKEEAPVSEEELRTIVNLGRREGILDKESAEMMHNVLEFRGTKVTEVMTPDANIEMINGTLRLGEVIDFVIKTPYSRYPVYMGNEDNIIGYLDVDDMLRYVKNKKLSSKVKSAIKPAYFVPESKEVDDLLMEFENKKIALAIVVDEYGHISGMVTVEDILEEIVGDIFDKSRKDSSFIRRINDKMVRINAKASLEEVNRMLHLSLSGRCNTLAGFIEDKLQRIPKKGEELRMKGYTIVIDKVTNQMVKSVKVIMD